ncbi:MULTISPECIES: ATP-binding protein [unclassified Undibacterium]|uniref:ATP-binding protein n=1 Tax=unclassified Undibacterium TaxID=2630295 RepID=UPI002AC8D41D|nr:MULTISPECIES: ATP-binding protein [unclassified Undibacterium]MEB0137798.1 ATP-binding protein [Undibacterium sp. CCC2.1]MEB0171011.1 ATP-binding protein [Undibacterium sp. CCC1.1]MEB0175056.1 ATP-binding protein [Undibacterium sp. CCC3.4]MEB0215166.1 ATP-binding protein [Undibacterium sp. 5I2]WPX44860.1 ATP-binding protein [Undibacterium sp. CCC3.4]
MKMWSSMWGRVFAIILLGMLSSTALTGWLAFGEREKTLMQYRVSHSIERTEQLALALDVLPRANRETFLATAPPFGMQVTSLPANTAASTSPSHSEYARAVSERLSKSFRVIPLPDDASNCPNPRGDDRPPRPGKGPIPPPCEALGITLHDGTSLRLTIMPPRPAPAPLHTDFLQFLLVFLLCIALLAYLVARMTMKPLQRMAEAATALGQDFNSPALPEQGASEIVQATRAFNAMQARLREHISQRTHMLGAITHDLQTPLTRLRLRLEKVSDEELRQRLIGDLSAMQSMIKEGLDLARSMDSSEALRAVDIDSLLDSMCSDAVEAGQDVRFDNHPGITVQARPQALRRCLTNLIDNAVKYGNYAQITLDISKQNKRSLLNIRIADGGSGIAPEFHRKVFEPFFRLETSRSRESGGTGLGLSIAQNIAQQHGGEIQLINLPQGGLQVVLSLPLSI